MNLHERDDWDHTLDARARLERDAMAWPPAGWERESSSWRTDVDPGVESFLPYVTPAIPVPRKVRWTGIGSLAREILETVMLTALMFVGIRLVVQNFRIEGRSMEPTLETAQYLLVNKLSYRVFGKPQRGDIVVFEAWGQDKDFIKRIIGRPGDELEIRDNAVYVNGVALDEPYTKEGVTRDTLGPITLADNEYYVLGDNRGNSSDSRTFGPLPADKIVGKAWLTYWPPGNIGPIPSNTTSFASSP